jgi:L-asparaginase II
MGHTVEVVGLRNGHIETVHSCSVRVWEGGRVVLALGEDTASFWRSACKPFQLMNSLGCLEPGEVAKLGPEDLALGAASHSGQPAHVQRVRSLLGRFELRESDLQCGAHAPMHEPSARGLAAYDLAMSNCSGKHTYMLAACRNKGWNPDYRSIEHPLQKGNRTLLDLVCDCWHQVGVDGCSVPTFHAPLSAQARAWGYLSEMMAGGDPEAPGSSPSLLGRIGWAMARQPFWMSGDSRLDLAVVQGASEPVAVKIGAEGLFCVARPGAKQGVAVKVHSGVSEALAPLVRYALAQVGVTISGELPGRLCTTCGASWSASGGRASSRRTDLAGATSRGG